MVEKSESLRTNVRVENKAALGDPNEIARMQLRRFKRRLGTLTLDQELQIENLLFSTVAKISLVAQTVMEALVENSPTKSAMFPYDVVKLWRTVGEVGQSRADYFTDEGECFANTSD